MISETQHIAVPVAYDPDVASMPPSSALTRDELRERLESAEAETQRELAAIAERRRLAALEAERRAAERARTARRIAAKLERQRESARRAEERAAAPERDR